jgi:hypothetical protein
MSKGEKVAFVSLIVGVWGSLFCFVGINLYQVSTGIKVPGSYLAGLVLIAIVSAVVAQFIFLPRFRRTSESEVTTLLQRVVRRLYYAICLAVVILAALKYFGAIDIPTYIGNIIVVFIFIFGVLDTWVRRAR